MSSVHRLEPASSGDPELVLLHDENTCNRSEHINPMSRSPKAPYLPVEGGTPELQVEPSSQQKMQCLEQTALLRRTNLDSSRISQLTIEDNFLSIRDRDENSKPFVNYFSKSDSKSIQREVSSETIFCCDEELRSIWNAQVDDICLPEKFLDTGRGGGYRRCYLDDIEANLKQNWDSHEARWEALKLSMEYSQKAKTAILIEASSNCRDKSAEESCINTTHVGLPFASAANIAASHRQTWSILADQHLSIQYANCKSIECMIFCKEVLKLFDKEILAIKRTFSKLIRQSGDGAITRIKIGEYSCRRCRALQYHKRRLFNEIKSLQHSSIDTYHVCIDISVKISCILSVWLGLTSDLSKAMSYTMECLNRAVDQGNEDSWVEVIMLLRAIAGLLLRKKSEIMNSRCHRDTLEGYVQAERDIEIYLKYAEAKLESTYANKLVAAACRSHSVDQWTLLKHQQDRCIYLWNNIEVMLLSGENKHNYTEDTVKVLTEEIKIAKYMICEWTICVSLKMSQFDSFRATTLSSKGNMSISRDASVFYQAIKSICFVCHQLLDLQDCYRLATMSLDDNRVEDFNNQLVFDKSVLDQTIIQQLQKIQDLISHFVNEPLCRAATFERKLKDQLEALDKDLYPGEVAESALNTIEEVLFAWARASDIYSRASASVLDHLLVNDSIRVCPAVNNLQQKIAEALRHCQDQLSHFSKMEIDLRSKWFSEQIKVIKTMEFKLEKKLLECSYPFAMCLLKWKNVLLDAEAMIEATIAIDSPTNRINQSDYFSNIADCSDSNKTTKLSSYTALKWMEKLTSFLLNNHEIGPCERGRHDFYQLNNELWKSLKTIYDSVMRKLKFDACDSRRLLQSYDCSIEAHIRSNSQLMNRTWRASLISQATTVAVLGFMLVDAIIGKQS